MGDLADSFLKDLAGSSASASDEEANLGLATDDPEVAASPSASPDSNRSVSGLLESPDFLESLHKVLDDANANDDSEEHRTQRLEFLNDNLQKVDREILRIFQICKDVYGRRFPELEALLPAPLDYLFVMRKLQNDLHVADEAALNEKLSNAAVLAVTVAASVSIGRELPAESVDQLLAHADQVDQYVEIRSKLIERIEKSMSVAAPNLTAIVGFALAARLVAHAGGLHQLATMPSQNLLVVGGSSYARRTAAVTASSGEPTALPQVARSAGRGYGVIYECDLVLSTPPPFRSRALRLVVGKAALAVRKDVFHNDGSNTTGQQLRALIVEKLRRVQTPPPARLKKPLPVPEEKPHARRGGRRKRKWKEKYGMTELRKKANRLPVTIESAAEPERLQNEDDDDDDVF